jgi:hypothetical protein
METHETRDGRDAAFTQHHWKEGRLLAIQYRYIHAAKPGCWYSIDALSDMLDMSCQLGIATAAMNCDD